MARQTFTRGQRVYIKLYRDHYTEAEVGQPDVVHSAGYGERTRNIHYVEVVYCRNGKPTGHARSILNNREHIIPSEAYAEIERGREIDRLRSTVRIHTRWEEKFTAYIEQAKSILDEFTPLKMPIMSELPGQGLQFDAEFTREATITRLSEINKLALQLKGTFDLRDERSRHTTEEVAELRAERKSDAEKAQRTLDE